MSGEHTVPKQKKTERGKGSQTHKTQKRFDGFLSLTGILYRNLSLNRQSFELFVLATCSFDQLRKLCPSLRWFLVNNNITAGNGRLLLFFQKSSSPWSTCVFLSLEEEESLTSHDVAASAITAGILVNLDLETSIPDTYRSPPTPLPYDMVFGCPQSTDSDSVRETNSCSSFETSPTCGDLEESDCKVQESSLPISPKKLELSKSNKVNVLAEEDEDVCPICLEGYETENPDFTTKCEHHYHLSCILEWMERSDACPICDQELVLDHTYSL